MKKILLLGMMVLLFSCNKNGPMSANKDIEDDEYEEMTASYILAKHRQKLRDDITKVSDSIWYYINIDTGKYTSNIIEVKEYIYRLGYDYGELYHNDTTCRITGGIPACPDSIMIAMVKYVENRGGGNIDTEITIPLLNGILRFHPNLKGTEFIRIINDYGLTDYKLKHNPNANQNDEQK